MTVVPTAWSEAEPFSTFAVDEGREAVGTLLYGGGPITEEGTVGQNVEGEARAMEWTGRGWFGDK